MTMRSTILATLRNSQGEWVSGEALSNSLNVSRTTIWKQIKTLIEEGYEVDSSPKKGYRLVAPADVLSADEVGPGLKTASWGHTNYIYCKEIDSTNNHAKALAAEGYPEGTIVVAETQTAGRGRRGRDWFSPAHQGLYMSVILRPSLPLKEISRISLVTAVALAEALEEQLNLKPQIKWPNDVLINNRKIAGILSEAVTDMESVEYVVVGVGLNINNSLEEFPGDLRTPATSVLAEQAHPGSRAKILQSLLFSLERHYQFLLNGNFALTLAQAKSLSLVIGRQVQLDSGNSIISGQAIDINEDGFLMVRDQNGMIHTVMSGEISVGSGHQ